MRSIWHCFAASCALVGLQALSESQQFSEGAGRFTNFETPQTHPIEIATLSGTDYVLVCNTPDDSVEIYQANATAPYLTFKSSIRVGLGPASVRYTSGRFYSCNFDGDSVSVVRLTGGSASVTNPILERTVPVGDEPADIAFSGNVAAVSLSSTSRIAGFLFPGMTAISPPQIILEAPSNDEEDEAPYAVKTPRQLLWAGDFLYAANLRGGSPRTAEDYDVAIFQYDAGEETGTFVGGLGTTHHAFALNTAGDLMFVVGTKAKNNDAFGLANVAAVKTGFVQSWLWTVDIDGSAMTRRPEAEPNEISDLESINLNRDYTEEELTEVAFEDALSQPTDIVLVQDGSEIERIAITAYHSDRVAFLTPDDETPGGYVIERVEVPTQGSGSYSIAGPRGIVHSAVTGFFYTNGRLDNSLHVIDPDAGSPVLASIALHDDPTPLVIREGRKFLYSAELSGNGAVACASCHPDGRQDSVAWDLGENVTGPDIAPEFHDGDMEVTQVPEEYAEEGHITEFPPNKGRMVTQTMQGLINFPLNEEMQFASTNAPYYWRGVRRGPDDAEDPFKELTEAFDTFNEGYVKLLGMPDIDAGDDVRGISVEDMRKFRLFVNTIFYPPNPEQPRDRTVPGTLPGNPNDASPTLGEGFSGSLMGMTAFFNAPSVSTVGPETTLTTTCNDCHPPTSGSSKTATLLFAAIDGETLTATGDHPFESAALRNLTPREMWLHDDFTTTPTHIVSNTALLHPGTPEFQIDSDDPPPDPGVGRVTSINTFLFDFFPVGGFGLLLVKFVREFDTGIAPAVGTAYTVGSNSTTNNNEFEFLETQVEHGNIGLAVYTRNSGTKKGYWYDPIGGVYVEEATANTLSRASLLALGSGTGNVVVAQATPLGADRRWASLTGVAAELTGSAPSSLALRGMVPNTEWVDVVKFDTFGLHLGLSPDIDVLSSTDPLIQGTTIWALRTLQHAVLDEFGVPAAPRHEPPRRFRVTGTNIRPGARLILESANEDPLEMDLYPVTTSEGVVWETFVEMEALHVFALLNGGFRDSGVETALLRRDTDPVLEPLTNNVYKIRVINEDDTEDDETGEVLTIHDDRDTID